jgi:hypothetical protein
MILYEQESSQVRIRAQNKSEKIEFNWSLAQFLKRDLKLVFFKL